MSRKKTRCCNKISGVYAITDARVSDPVALVLQVKQAVRGGIDVLQYRGKGIPRDQALENASLLAAICRQSDVTFIINDDVSLACEVNADGVHVGRNDGDLSHIRAALGDGILGVSCYNDIDYALQMAAFGADYVAFGRFFPSITKPEAIQAELALLPRARKLIQIPIVAIGGITPANAPPLLAAGVDSVAVVNGIFGQSDIEVASRRYANLFV